MGTPASAIRKSKDDPNHDPLERHYTTETDAAAHVGRLVASFFLKPSSYLVDPCAGQGAYLTASSEAGVVSFGTDIDPRHEAVLLGDMYATLRSLRGDPSARMVTNPPFSHAARLARLACELRVPCSLLVGLNFLEPTKERGALLRDHPPSAITFIGRCKFGRPPEFAAHKAGAMASYIEITWHPAWAPLPLEWL